MDSEVQQEINYYVAKWFNRRFGKGRVTMGSVAKIFKLFWQYAFKAAYHGYGIRPSSRRFALRMKMEIIPGEKENDKIYIKTSKNPYWAFKFIFFDEPRVTRKMYDLEFVPEGKYVKELKYLLETTDLPNKLLKNKYYLR